MVCYSRVSNEAANGRLVIHIKTWVISYQKSKACRGTNQVEGTMRHTQTT